MTVPGNLSSPLLAVAGGAAAAGDNNRSLRFDAGDGAVLDKTFSSASNRRTWTWSGWHKRAVDSGTNFLFVAGSTDAHAIYMNGVTGSATLVVSRYVGSFTYYLETNEKFRDPAAWLHIVVAFDSTQGTTSNRIKLYVNGNQITSFSSASYPSQNAEFEINNNVNHRIGKSTDGYLTNVHFIDGSALGPTSFGAFDSNGVWQVAAYSGTFGTNGFHLLDFANESTVGHDSSGNNNDFTATNLSDSAGTGNDVLADHPVNGSATDTGAGGEVNGCYCTFNPLTTIGGNSNSSSAVLSQGNMKSTNPASTSWNVEVGTMALRSGKWYYEYVVSGSVSNFLGGWADPREVNYTDAVGNTSRSYGYYNTGNVRNGNSNTSFGSSYTAGDIIGCAIDIDNRKIYWSKNGTWQNSADPAAGTGSIYTIADPVANNFFYTIAVSTYDASQSVDINTGQRAFSYTAPSGFKAICSANLATPAVADGSDAFAAITYTGTGSQRSITTGFSPDLVWVKYRSGAAGGRWYQYDIIRGAQKYLSSNTTDGEASQSNGLEVFQSDGFRLGNHSSHNYNNDEYVSFSWDCGSSNATNTSGSITSTVRANIAAGCAVVKWTGISSSGTVGHGLGVKPAFIIAKKYSSGGSQWPVYHAANGATKYNYLNSNIETRTYAHFWNNTEPTTSVFSIGGDADVSGNGTSHIAWVFAPVEGFSAMGNYVSTGTSDGVFVYTGFAVAWLLIKRTNGGANWVVMDSARSPINPAGLYLRPNQSDQEIDTSSESNKNHIDFLSNGFKVRGTDTNTGGAQTYMWVAFASNPFQSNGGLAR